MVKNIRNIKNTKIQKYIKPYNQETRKPGNLRKPQEIADIRSPSSGYITWAPGHLTFQLSQHLNWEIHMYAMGLRIDCNSNNT